MAKETRKGIRIKIGTKINRGILNKVRILLRKVSVLVKVMKMARNHKDQKVLLMVLKTWLVK